MKCQQQRSVVTQRNKDEAKGETMALSLEFRRSFKEKQYSFEFRPTRKWSSQVQKGEKEANIHIGQNFSK